MNDCKSTSELLEFYVDSELDAVLTRAVSEHLESCVVCNRKMEALRLQNELIARAVKSVETDNRNLRASIEAATIARHQRLLEWSLPRIPAWTVATAAAILFISISFFLLPNLVDVVANPLFRAAAENHRMCGQQSEDTDWARTPQAIADVEESFVGHNKHAPITTEFQYQLVRARVCVLNGEKFLHLIYRNDDGNEASLFVRRNDSQPLDKDRNVTADGVNVQSSKLSDLYVAGIEVGPYVLITAAQTDVVSSRLLRSAVARFET